MPQGPRALTEVEFSFSFIPGFFKKNNFICLFILFFAVAGSALLRGAALQPQARGAWASH